MIYAICIGAYKLTQFVELCVLRCRRVFGDVPILISDDLSINSPAIKALAEKHDCDYVVGPSQRSHFSGDMQAFVNLLKFMDELQVDVGLKLSQRFIPVLPRFKETMDETFSDSNIQLCLPGQMAKRQIARPRCFFYGKFGILSDCLALRRGAITPEELLECYRARCKPGQKSSDSFAETTWGHLLATKFADRHRIMQEWTHHKPFESKIYLRKSQATEPEYAQVAAMEGVKGYWDVREWGQIEGKEYQSKPTVV